MNIVERFFSYVQYSNDCWVWKGCLDENGYGYFWCGETRKVHRSHRWSFEYFVGSLEGKFACHHCDNPSCVNPFHLFAGTNGDNMVDCVKKGRHSLASRTHCPKGHPYSGENLRIVRIPNGNLGRVCRACSKVWARKQYQKVRLRRLAG